MTHGSGVIVITRRMLLGAMLASGLIGVAVGELAAPLEAPQAHAVAATAAPGCAAFATTVGHDFETLGAILTDASAYPPLIPKAYDAGSSHSPAKYRAVTRKVASTNAKIDVLAKKFEATKTPLLKQEKRCLS